MTEHSEERDQTAPGKAVQENMPEPEEMPGGTLGRDRPEDEPGNAGTVREHVGGDEEE
jgi:hypothetical protein